MLNNRSKRTGGLRSGRTKEEAATEQIWVRSVPGTQRTGLKAPSDLLSLTAFAACVTFKRKLYLPHSFS